MSNIYFDPTLVEVSDGDTAVEEDINDLALSIETAIDLMVADLGGDLTVYEPLVDGSDASALHNHTTDNLNDTDATGAELTSLTNNSMVDTLHRHSELSASDGSPDKAWSVDSTGHFLPALPYSIGVGYAPVGEIHAEEIWTWGNSVSYLGYDATGTVSLTLGASREGNGDVTLRMHSASSNGEFEISKPSGPLTETTITNDGELYIYPSQGLLLSGTNNDSAAWWIEQTGELTPHASNSSPVIGTTSAPVEQIVTDTLNINSIPTSASGLSSGDVWSNSGVLTIVS